MTDDLTGLTVWVTRPAPSGRVLSEYIEKAGGRAVYCPTIEITPPRDPALFAEQLQRLASFDWLIFVSQQAVYAFSAVFKGTFPRAVKVAAMGPGTAEALMEAGIPVHCYPRDAWHSEGLLALPEFQVMQNQRVALVRGEGGREYLANELALRGALLTHMIAYQRSPTRADLTPCMDLLKTKQIDLIVATSNAILEQLVALFGAELVLLVPLVVISERMILAAKKLGFKTILLATNASHDGIMEALRGYLWQMK